jgi:hypothetical protein
MLHKAAGDLGNRIGAYQSGLATLALFLFATFVILWPRIARSLRSIENTARSVQSPPVGSDRNLSHQPGEPLLAKPGRRLKVHIAAAIAAMLPFWWHCELQRASPVDQLLKGTAILLVISGVLGVTALDILYQHPFTQGFLKYWSATHRMLALITFSLIAIHVVAVLYFVGL